MFDFLALQGRLFQTRETVPDKGDCSRPPVPHPVRLVCKRSGVQSSKQESGRAEADVAQKSNFVLYSRINGQPLERSKMRRYMVSFGNSQDKASIFVFNCLRLA